MRARRQAGGLGEERWRRSASQGFCKDRAQQGGEGPEGWRECGSG